MAYNIATNGTVAVPEGRTPEADDKIVMVPEGRSARASQKIVKVPEGRKPSVINKKLY
jgi:hypothetical protein